MTFFLKQYWASDSAASFGTEMANTMSSAMNTFGCICALYKSSYFISVYENVFMTLLEYLISSRSPLCIC
jgi:hypothetical protein